MKLNLEWLKKHPAAAGGAILVGLLVLFLLFRKSGSSSGSDFASLAANQQQGQLQLAELNAQASSQENQLQAQLAATEYQTQAQEQESQNTLAASVAGSALPYEFEAPIYQQELKNQATTQASLIPLESEIVGEIPGLAGHEALQETSMNELALLLGELNPNITGAAGSLPTGALTPGSPTSFGLRLPGGVGFNTTLGTGLFA